ncbi:putative ABC transporter C family member 15 isoform X2 [Nymphaea colorata]|nr:putative ABC transporter C family member 15 isoform X2 [Nymphaea colorata]
MPSPTMDKEARDPNREQKDGIRKPLLEREEVNNEKRPASFTNANIWRRMTFGWLNPLFDLGRRKTLELTDVPIIPDEDSARRSSLLLETALQKQKELSFPRAIFSTVWKPLAVTAIYAGLTTISSYMGPLLITMLIDVLASSDSSPAEKSHGYVLALCLFFSKAIESFSQRHWYFGAQMIGVRVRAGLMVLIYRRALSMKCRCKSVGEMVNLMSVDVEKIGDFAWYFHGLWLLPIQISLALFILYINLGIAPSLAALLATIVIMVGNTPLAKLQENFHSKIMGTKDRRVKATAECLKFMRILKFQSWETLYMEKILKLRDTEKGWLRKYLYTCAAVAFLFWAAPAVVSVATFNVCILMGTPLTASKVFAALATFRILQEPIYNLPELLSMIAQTKVSLDRIASFVFEDEEGEEEEGRYFRVAECNADMNIGVGEINMKEGGFSWEMYGEKPMVTTINLQIKRGQKIAVCGSVGSGKSSLLLSILGEIHRVSGDAVEVSGSKAYVAQSAWIQTGTISENILFGREKDDNLYSTVLRACALEKDLSSFPYGDQTLVGERGVNLSGGQKQRIQLARALYSNADVYLLDDPFSAVDAHTGSHLFKECLMGVLADRTVVYVTHQLEFLSATDLVLVMREGKVVQSGKCANLMADESGELYRLMTAHKKTLKNAGMEGKENDASPTSVSVDQLQFSQKEEKWPIKSNTRDMLVCHCEEEREKGRVKLEVYSTFVKTAYRGALVPLILLCQVAFLALQMGSNYWIAWATDGNDGGRTISRRRLMSVYVMLSAGSAVCVLGRALLLATAAMETAQKLFVKMLMSVFRAPISFFDLTPSSRMLNRSSTDQSTLDTDIPYRLAGLVFALIQLLSIIILMSLVSWQVFVVFLVVIAICIWYQGYYISTARELARMVNIRKAPILHHISESVSGAATVRCFDQEGRFLEKKFGLVDDYSSLVFHNFAGMEWLCLRMNFLFNLAFFFVLIALVSLPKSQVDPSLAGLIATYGLNLNVLQAWVLWNLCNVENKMISVERILQFCNIASEAPLVIEDSRPEPQWPQKGTIEITDLYVRYSPHLPFVLQGVSCIFPGQKKIGIVGRTGSGKSTLIQALFRLVEPSSGTIRVDGVDIGMIGLQDLRARMSIIPQDPSLFQGTLRCNLDPFQQYTDLAIWEALDKCHLGNLVRRDGRQLDAPIDEDGGNWSVGQRQLLCLARALLKQRRIVVLDEVTASIDTATDHLIQKTIRQTTRDCTVITIAHRLPTVVDNDFVLVLHEGKVLEYDSPDQLLKDSSSAFSKLATEMSRRSKGENHPSSQPS